MVVFGDRVRIKKSPETLAAGIAGREGEVDGLVSPLLAGLVAGSDVIGEASEAWAVHVKTDTDGAGFWLRQDLVECLHSRHVGAMIGTEFSIPDPARPLPPEPMGPSGELTPFVPAALAAADVVGRQIDAVSLLLGTYGMGGCGYFGLQLGREWLVVSIWGAGEWMLLDDRLVEDTHAEEYGRPRPWCHGGVDELSGRLVGSRIETLDVQPHSLAIQFSNGAVLRIDEGPERRPIWEGTRQPRTFGDHDDLRKGVFLSPSAELWT